MKNKSNKLTQKDRSVKTVNMETISTTTEDSIKTELSLDVTSAQEKKDEFCCPYCHLSFASKYELKLHCTTDEHQAMLVNDEGRQWVYRFPPRSVTEFLLCSNINNNTACRFGDLCTQAHSIEELEEWKERFLYRSMKVQKAMKRELHGASYADIMLEKIKNSKNIDSILAEKVPGVICNIDSNLNVCMTEKPSHHDWVITLQKCEELKGVTMLYDTFRHHFSLEKIAVKKGKSNEKSIEFGGNQEWVNKDFNPDLQISESLEYTIKVSFSTTIYGTFRQAIVLDFGSEPLLIKRFCVDIVSNENFKNLQDVKKAVVTRCERWCRNSCQISDYYKNNENEEYNELVRSYPPPTNSNIRIHQSSLEKIPTIENYVTRMHDLLNYEEMAQFDLISNFNVQCMMPVSESYIINLNAASEVKYSVNGELFAKMELASELSEDSPQGRIILNQCSSALIARRKRTTNVDEGRKIYQVLIDAKSKKEIYFKLSREAVEALNLTKDEEFEFDVQFDLSRHSICEMHYAIDHLKTLKPLFPNTLAEPIVPWNPVLQWQGSSDVKLNLKQREALIAISTRTSIHLPPIIIIGPFGTGKTYTMAQAILEVVKQPNTRILVCTHSNSAADIYIKEYFHLPYKSGELSTKPLRIYYKNRRPATVDKIVQEYSLMSDVDGARVFSYPTKEDLNEPRIVITTINTSMVLNQIGLGEGFFTHILIDEAAQVIECSTLIPLALANDSTRIVLAGDYMQLNSEVFSGLCRERNFHLSLLERLYDLYSDNFPCKIMLVENYRSHPEIVKYTSKHFYDNRLISKSKTLAHPMYSALAFFTARGEDVQDQNSTAFYNNSEVMEIVEMVNNLIKTWPVKLWGPVKEESIGVVTPYLDQVVRIRAALRKKKFYKVSVERVFNVQGKEFRAIILSTVRTRNSCSEADANLDFGFLSNAKLLTTAITRAQSLVAVVGDPVSLCSVGKCSKLWEKFIEQCAEKRSLFGIEWKELKNLLNGIEYRKIYGLNPLAKVFVPRAIPVPLLTGLPVYSSPYSTFPHPYYPVPHPGIIQNMPYQTPARIIPPWVPMYNPHHSNMYGHPAGPGMMIPRGIHNVPSPNIMAPYCHPYGGSDFYLYNPIQRAMPYGYYPGLPGCFPTQRFPSPYPPQQIPVRKQGPVPLTGFNDGYLVHSNTQPLQSAATVSTTESPDTENVRFLSNVHFPNANESPTPTPGNSQHSSGNAPSKPAVTPEDPDLTISSADESCEPMNVTTSPEVEEVLEQEISRLLNDKSPTMGEQIVLQSPSNVNHRTNELGLSGLRSALNLNERRTNSGLKTVNNNTGHISNGLSQLQAIVNSWEVPPPLDSTDYPTLLSTSFLQERRDRTNFINKNNSTSCNLPLYLRKGSQKTSNSLNSNTENVNLGVSSGWNLESLSRVNSVQSKSKSEAPPVSNTYAGIVRLSSREKDSL